MNFLSGEITPDKEAWMQKENERLMRIHEEKLNDASGTGHAPDKFWMQDGFEKAIENSAYCASAAHKVGLN
jgi:hypothetical protein